MLRGHLSYLHLFFCSSCPAPSEVKSALPGSSGAPVALRWSSGIPVLHQWLCHSTSPSPALSAAWSPGPWVRQTDRRELELRYNVGRRDVRRGAQTSDTAWKYRHKASYPRRLPVVALCQIFTTLSEIWEITFKCFPRRKEEIESPIQLLPSG